VFRFHAGERYGVGGRCQAELIPRSPSQTAVMTAVARALHREEPTEKVLDDDLAFPLAGEQGTAILARLRSEVPPDLLVAFSRWVCVRARLPEDIVERAVADGVRQYVILGAGLDSFAYRRPDLLDRLRVFEVDHPASQAWKQARLRELGVVVPANLVFSPVDFERQTLRDGLERAGFDFSALAVFSWIGVTMYLTVGAIEATLTTVTECPAGTQIVMTYNVPTPSLDRGALGTRNVLARIAADMGEPFVSLFEPAEAEDLLRRMGFDDIVDFGPEEAIQTYFAGRDDVQIHGAQRLLVAKRSFKS
jgi:methyltransferase (TIGR00027 family)